MRPGRDFWIDVLRDGSRRLLERGGGIRGASRVEAALWDRLASEKLLPRPPRWYFDAVAARAAPSPGEEPR
jgi:hypothetical protein